VRLPIRPRSLPAPVVSTPTFVQSKSGASPDAQVSSLQVTLDTAATAGNLLVIGACSDATIATPSGWSLGASAVSAQGAYLFYKIAAGGETTITVQPGVARPCAMVAAEYSAIAASPLDQTVTAVFSGASSVSASPGTTPSTTQATELAVAAVCPHSFADNAQPVSPSWSNSYTGRGAATSAYTTVGAQNSGVFLADVVLTSTGTTTTTATWTNSSQDYGAILATFKGA
jgi:hypothetical protein